MHENNSFIHLLTGHRLHNVSEYSCVKSNNCVKINSRLCKYSCGQCLTDQLLVALILRSALLQQIFYSEECGFLLYNLTDSLLREGGIVAIDLLKFAIV